MVSELVPPSPSSDGKKDPFFPGSLPCRNFLFLQGPNGRFFATLAKELRRLGHSCRRINLCPADWWFWSLEGADNFRDSPSNWRAYLRRYLQVHRITDLIFNGGQRFYHKIAADEARQMGVQVYATDFGYLRTDWVAFEKNGMSGDSLLTRDPAAIRDLARQIPRCDFGKKYAQPFRDMAIAEVLGNAVDLLGGWLFPEYQSHHLYHPLHSGWGTIQRKITARFFRGHAKALIEQSIQKASECPLYLFPMQLESDFQLRAYSPFSSMREPLELIIRSFSRHAPVSAQLLIKVHPLDPGVVGWRKTVKTLATTFGVAHRVSYVDVGLLDEIIRSCRGIVTINSTVGIIGLRFEKNVKTLGQAIYDIPGITFQGTLDAFWQAPEYLDADLCRDYLKVLAGCLHVRGSFYSQPGMQAAVRGIAYRLHTNSVNSPMDPLGFLW